MRRFKALAGLTAGLLLLSTAAVADTFKPSEAQVSIDQGGTETVAIVLTADALEPYEHPGCDVQGGAHQVMTTVTSSNNNVATATWQSPFDGLFTECGVSETLIVTGVANGEATITVAADLDHPDSKLSGDSRVGFHSAKIEVTVTDGGTGPEEPVLECSAPAAPAWAAHILKHNGQSNAYVTGQGRNQVRGNYVADVAHHMGPGATFSNVEKSDSKYGAAVLDWLNERERLVGLTMPEDWPADECIEVGETA